MYSEYRFTSSCHGVIICDVTRSPKWRFRENVFLGRIHSRDNPGDTESLQPCSLHVITSALLAGNIFSVCFHEREKRRDSTSSHHFLASTYDDMQGSRPCPFAGEVLLFGRKTNTFCFMLIGHLCFGRFSLQHPVFPFGLINAHSSDCNAQASGKMLDTLHTFTAVVAFRPRRRHTRRLQLTYVA